MSKPVVIFGTGDFARVASVYLRDDSGHEVAAFTVNLDRMQDRKLLGREVVPFESLQETHPPDQFAMLVAIGFKGINRARAGLYEKAKAQGYQLISYVNSTVKVWNETHIGDNCFIFENNVVQPFEGMETMWWSGAAITSDTTPPYGDHCFIASHVVISGNVTIGPYCFIGVNATFRDGVNVGANCVIGAGAIILQDTQDSEVYAASATAPHAKKTPGRSAARAGRS